ncbi:MAG: FliH/SctL family protein [Deltaproteobacteria bacterium]|nr:FliH/SctL family protein [Deltaproteobacteria bacterium]
MSGKIVKRNDLASELAFDGAVKVGLSQEGKVIRKDVHKAVADADRIIEQGREEANRIKRDAESILKRVEAECLAARKEGYAKGKEEGLGQVTELLAKATHSKEKMFEGLEKDLIRLVYDIAEKIIGRDLSEREGGVVDLIRQALHAAIGEKITVLVNPADIEAVRKNQPALMQMIDSSRTLQVRADEKVKPKGCLIESEIGTIDAQLETQLEAIRKALGIEE